MVSYNKLVKIFSQWAAAHNQVKNFGAGERWQVTDHDQTASFKYPLMWVEDNSFNAAEREFTYGFTIWFVTRVESPADRGTDILFSEFTKAKSDMIGIAQDFIAYWIQDNDYPTIQLSESVSLDTFIETTPDRLTGCSIQVNFSDSFNYDNCIIPMDDMPTPPTSEVTVTVNGDSYFTLTCGSTGNVVVKDTDGNEVGSKIGNEWIVPAAVGGSIDIDINGVPFLTNQSTNVDIPVLNTTDDSPSGTKIGNTWYIDSTTVNVNNTNVLNEKAEATINLYVKNSEGVNIGTPNYPNTDVADCTQTINGAAITNQLPETSKTFVIRYANNNPVTVTTITDTETSFIGEVPDVVVPNNSATTFKDGQTTSYVTGDAGQYEDGEGVDFLTLSWTNDFGNTNRLTSENGDQTYTAGYVVDHASKNQNTGRIRVWKLGLESAVASTHLSGQPYTYGGLTDWKIPRIIDIYQIMNHEQATTALNYAPFNINANSIANSLILQNTLNATTGYRFANSLILASATLSNTMRRICYRDCTLAEINTL